MDSEKVTEIISDVYWFEEFHSRHTFREKVYAAMRSNNVPIAYADHVEEIIRDTLDG